MRSSFSFKMLVIYIMHIKLVKCSPRSWNQSARQPLFNAHRTTAKTLALWRQFIIVCVANITMIFVPLYSKNFQPKVSQLISRQHKKHSKFHAFVDHRVCFSLFIHVPLLVTQFYLQANFLRGVCVSHKRQEIPSVGCWDSLRWGHFMPNQANQGMPKEAINDGTQACGCD